MGEGALEWPVPPGMDPGAAARLKGFLAETAVSAGQTVFDEGDPGTGMFMVAAGSVGIVKRISPGVERRLATLRAGGIFGELALITGEPRSGSAAALEDSALLSLSQAAWDRMAVEAPDLRTAWQSHLLEVVSRRLRDTTEMYRQAVEWSLGVSGAVELNFDRLVAERQGFEIRTVDGGAVRGTLVRADKLEGGREFWLRLDGGGFAVIPYHGVASIHFLGPEG